MNVLSIDPAACVAGDFDVAVAWLRDAGILIYPTDTLYGMAVDPTSAAAVRALFSAKGRASSAPLPLIAASLEQVEVHCGRLPDAARRLAVRFWPGPLSL